MHATALRWCAWPPGQLSHISQQPCNLSRASVAAGWARSIPVLQAGCWEASGHAAFPTEPGGHPESTGTQGAHGAEGQKEDTFKEMLFLRPQRSEKYFEITDGACIQSLLSSPVLFCTEPTISPLIPSFHVSAVNGEKAPAWWQCLNLLRPFDK